MAQNGDSSQRAVEKRLDKLEKLLTHILQNKQGGTSRESSSNCGSSNENRKRAASDHSDEGNGRTENESFDCTLCDRKYQNKSSLFRHIRDTHKLKSPERMHTDNLAKKARLEETNVNEANKDNNCKLCEAVFNTTSSRNSHYTGKHQIKDEKLLFFPNGSALVESSYENEIRKNPQWLNAIFKRGMPAGVCKLCEVQLGNDDLKFHYEKEHKVFQMSKLKNLIRLNNADIKKIAVCEICDHCSDTFTDREALEDHKVTVHADLFKKCKFCNEILEINNYNEHIKNEHPDLFFKKVNIRITPTKVVKPQSDNVPKTSAIKKDAKIAEKTVKEQAKVSARRASFRPQPKRDVPLMYMCDACNLVTTSYDNAIAHSQDHILNTVSKELKLCEICDLTFGADYDLHKEMHSTDDDLDRDSFRFVPYDYKNLANDKWLDMFEPFSKSKVNRITSASIYFSTRCVRLKLVNDCKDASSQFTMFKCLTCLNYVHPTCVESHVGQRDACTNQTFNHQCIKCTKTFYTAEAMDEHAETHKIPDSGSRYRTVWFNDPSDLNYNITLLKNAGKSVVEKVVNENNANVKAVEKITIATNVTEEKANNVTNGGKVVDVYKCECGLCFDRFKYLLIHMQNCSADLNKNESINCPCGLVFDRINFNYHCEVHKNYSITTFNVKKLMLVDDIKIDARGTSENFMKTMDEKFNKINSNSTNNQGTPKDVRVQNVLIRTRQVSKDIDMSAVVDKEHDQEDVSMKEVGSDMKESNDASRKIRSECTGDKIVDSVDENPKIGDENVVEHSKEIQKVAPDLIARNGKPAVVINREDSNNNKNCTQDSENTQENNLMVETTMEVELQENVDTHIITIKSHDEEQLHLINNDKYDSGQINQSREITTEALDQNELIPHEIKKGNEISITKIAQQNKEHTAGQERSKEKTYDQMVAPINNTNENPEVLDSVTIDNKLKSNDSKINPNIRVNIETRDENNTAHKSHNTDDKNIEDCDEEELLRGLEDVTESLLTDDEDQIDGESDGDWATLKRKIQTLFSSQPNKKIKQGFIDFLMSQGKR